MKKGLIYILLTTFLWTTTEPVGKLVSNEINPFAFTFIRFFIGGSMLLPFSAHMIRKNNIQLSKLDYLRITLLGVLCICISMVLLQFAVMVADSPALIAIIFSANSVFTILFAVLILKDKITAKKWCAIGLCIAGVLVCIDYSSQSNLFSVILAVLSAMTFSLYTVLSKKYMVKISGIIQAGLSFFMGSLVLLAVLLVMKTEVIGGININNIGPMIYLGFLVTGVGYWSYFRAMEKASVMAASLVFFIKPVLTPFAVFFINGIAPDFNVFIALILVLGGSYLATVKTQGEIETQGDSSIVSTTVKGET